MRDLGFHTVSTLGNELANEIALPFYSGTQRRISTRARVGLLEPGAIFPLGFCAFLPFRVRAHSFWMNPDEEHLKLLSIFHYVIGGISALFGCIPLIYAGIGAAVLFSPHPVFGSQGPHPAAVVGWFFVIFGLGAFLVAQSIALCLVLAGRFLSKLTHYQFVFVLACVQCIFFPFGTILGIFTIIVLSRPSVKALFGITPTPCPPGNPPAL